MSFMVGVWVTHPENYEHVGGALLMILVALAAVLVQLDLTGDNVKEKA